MPRTQPAQVELVDLPMNNAEEAIEAIQQTANAAAGLREYQPIDSTALVDVGKRIETLADAVLVGEFFERANAKILEVDTDYKPIADSAHKTWKGLRYLWDKAKLDAVAVRNLSRQLLGEYRTRKKREELALEAEAQAMARELAEADVVEQALDLQEDGHEHAAEVLLETPVVAIAPKVEEVEVAGVQFVDVWSFVVVDQAAINPAYLVTTVDTKAIQKLVETMKDKVRAEGAVGGIEVACGSRADKASKR